jgi:hypothetical protein
MRRATVVGVLVGLLALGGCAGEQSAAGPATGPVAAPTMGAPTVGAQGAAVAPAARAYVDAVGRQDLDGLVAAFAEDGVVVDVSRRIEGRDAIRTWADREVIGGSLRVDGVTELEPGVQRLRVHWAPGGSGGWAADYTFTVSGAGITEADLQYAR